jgi:hypothetical protein
VIDDEIYVDQGNNMDKEPLLFCSLFWSPSPEQSISYQARFKIMKTTGACGTCKKTVSHYWDTYLLAAIAS